MGFLKIDLSICVFCLFTNTQTLLFKYAELLAVMLHLFTRGKLLVLRVHTQSHVPTDCCCESPGALLQTIAKSCHFPAEGVLTAGHEDLKLVVTF